MRHRALLVLCVLVVSACGGDGEEVLAPEDVAGTYALVSVDGVEVPYFLIETGTTYSLEVTGGSLVLNANTTCTSTLSLTETVDGEADTRMQTAVCTYVARDGGLELVFPVTNTVVIATVVGSTITYVESGSVFVFQK